MGCQKAPLHIPDWSQLWEVGRMGSILPSVEWGQESLLGLSPNPLSESICVAKARLGTQGRARLPPSASCEPHTSYSHPGRHLLTRIPTAGRACISLMKIIVIFIKGFHGAKCLPGIFMWHFIQSCRGLYEGSTLLYRGKEAYGVHSSEYESLEFSLPLSGSKPCDCHFHTLPKTHSYVQLNSY